MRDVWKQRDELAREVDRLRAELNLLKMGPAGSAFELEAEVDRLRANIDIWQKTAEDALDENGRLRAENDDLRRAQTVFRIAADADKDEVERLQAESESRRQDLLLQTDATNHFKAEAYSALDEVKRLRAENQGLRDQLKAGRVTIPVHDVCYGDFVGECFRVGRVPCSECEAWNRRP